MKSIKILKNVELTAIYTVDQQVVGLITYSLKMYVKALNDTVKFKLIIKILFDLWTKASFFGIFPKISIQKPVFCL